MPETTFPGSVVIEQQSTIEDPTTLVPANEDELLEEELEEELIIEDFTIDGICGVY